MEEERSARKGERGMIMILMAIAIVGLIGAGSLAIDIGSALVTKSELQNVADAASLASTRELAMVYKVKYQENPDFNYKEYTLSGAEKSQIQTKAVSFAAANKAGGLSISVGNSDIRPAKVDSAGNLTYQDKGVRAVSVKGRRDDTSNGQVQTELARVLGINQIAITAESTAAISAMGTLKAGQGEFPIGLDEDWFNTHTCASGEVVKFYPTGAGSCSGWHTFDEKPASAARLSRIVDDIRTNKFVSPETTAGKTYYEFTGGTIASTIADLKKLWNQKQQAGHFRTTVPVYQSSGCVNPNQARLIVGFARIDITKVTTAPTMEVEGDVECGIFDQDVGSGGGNGGDFGVLIGTPGMIQ
jgi:Flp pilus assembly protein TadG